MIKYDHDSEDVLMASSDFYLVEESGILTIIKDRYGDKKHTSVSMNELFELMSENGNVAIENKEGIYATFEIEESDGNISVEEALNEIIDAVGSFGVSVGEKMKSIQDRL